MCFPWSDEGRANPSDLNAQGTDNQFLDRIEDESQILRLVFLRHASIRLAFAKKKLKPKKVIAASVFIRRAAGVKVGQRLRISQSGRNPQIKSVAAGERFGLVVKHHLVMCHGLAVHGN